MSGMIVEVHALSFQGSIFKGNISRCGWRGAWVKGANQDDSWVEPPPNILLEQTDYHKGPFF